MPTGIYERKPMSEETKRRISLANKGRTFTPEWIEKMRQAKLRNPVRYWLGRERPSPSEETKEKMRQANLRNGNKPPVRRGKDNNKWKGGISRGYKTGYYSTEYKNWRLKVFTRDNYICQGCGARGIYLTAHHIKSFAHFPELRFDLNNGLTLCETCHSKTDNYKGKKQATQSRR